MKIAILDDYQNVALEMADWSVLSKRAEITVFNDHVSEPSALVERLLPFDVVCAMRERTPLPRHVIERLPNLKLIASTGPGNASIDVAAAGERGIAVVHTGYRPDPIELRLPVLSSEEVLREIAPGRNRVLYLWGHLTAAHDAMLPLLGLRERLHPEFELAFVSNPDKSQADIPSHEQVRL